MLKASAKRFLEAAEVSMVVHPLMGTRLVCGSLERSMPILKDAENSAGEVTEQHRLIHRTFLCKSLLPKLFGVDPWDLGLRKLQLYSAACRDLCRHPPWFSGVLGAEALRRIY